MERKNSWPNTFVNIRNEVRFFRVCERNVYSLPLPLPSFLSRQNQRYQFPLVSVCLSHSYGCGYLNLGTTDCVASAFWDSHATYGGDDSLRIDASQGQVRTNASC